MLFLSRGTLVPLFFFFVFYIVIYRDFPRTLSLLSLLFSLLVGSVSFLMHLPDMGRFRTYKSNSLVDLLRVVRNKKHHYRELSDSLKKALGPVPDSFTEYFLSRFPRLLIHVFCAVSNGPCKDEPMFAHYFVPSDKS